MDQLNRGGESDMIVIGAIAHARRGERQQRPKPFAARIDEMPADFRDHRALRLERHHDRRIHVVEI